MPKIKKIDQSGYFFELFKTRKTAILLSFFLSNPTSRFAQHEVIKKCRLAKATASQELNRLVHLEVLGMERIGTTKLYSLNRGLLWVKQIKRFYNLSTPFLHDFLVEVSPHLLKAVLFGSFARGEDREDSDIDLLLVGEIPEGIAKAAAARIFNRYGKTISFLIRTPESYLLMKRSESILYSKILAGGEVLYGS